MSANFVDCDFEILVAKPIGALEQNAKGSFPRFDALRFETHSRIIPRLDDITVAVPHAHPRMHGWHSFVLSASTLRLICHIMAAASATTPPVNTRTATKTDHPNPPDLSLATTRSRGPLQPHRGRQHRCSQRHPLGVVASL
jgi:hypothetical protein